MKSGREMSALRLL